MTSTRIIGAGSFVPDRVIDNDRIVKAIPGWTADQILQKSGIRERRFLWDFDERTGKAIPPPADVWPRTGTDMCEAALRLALASARVDANELDALFLVNATADVPDFCHDALQLHKRFGMRSDAYADQFNSGCGGALYRLHLIRPLIESGACKTVALVAANLASAFLDRDVYTDPVVSADGKQLSGFLSMYLFGDGAAALILRAEDATDASGIIASVSGADYSALMIREGGGAMLAPMSGRGTLGQFAYVIDGAKVAQCFLPFMRQCLDGVLAKCPQPAPPIGRYYLHQANKRLVEAFVQSANLPLDRVAMHMDRYGNTTAAGTLILLAEDVANGVVKLGSGEVVLFAAIGAGIHYAAHVIRL
ncbi:3-ketoacyl-ACP synthase [Candidatus Uhrbacteria bacterium]|nr:3-ketoacyl-ACP synthase [Candidatus Uhrbacteria bacterium]